jgi:hypothetical protein
MGWLALYLYLAGATAADAIVRKLPQQIPRRHHIAILTLWPILMPLAVVGALRDERKERAAKDKKDLTP